MTNESAVEERSVVVEEIEYEEFIDERVFFFGFGSIVLPFVEFHRESCVNLFNEKLLLLNTCYDFRLLFLWGFYSV